MCWLSKRAARNLSRKQILITGASSGLGEAFALALACQRTHLVLVARRKKRLQQVAKRCCKKGASAEPVVCDLLDKEGRKRFFRGVLTKEGAPDLLINNAGFGAQGDFSEISLSRYEGMIELHCQAMVDAIHIFLPSMLERKSGEILNVSSAAAFFPSPYFSTYAATKSFMLHLSLALSAELEPKGIQVLCFCPGATKTEFQAQAGIKEEAPLLPQRSAEEVVAVALRDLKAKRWLSVPGWENRSFLWLSRLFPYHAGVRLAKKMIEKTL